MVQANSAPAGLWRCPLGWRAAGNQTLPVEITLAEMTQIEIGMAPKFFIPPFEEAFVHD